MDNQFVNLEGFHAPLSPFQPAYQTQGYQPQPTFSAELDTVSTFGALPPFEPSSEAQHPDEATNQLLQPDNFNWDDWLQNDQTEFGTLGSVPDR